MEQSNNEDTLMYCLLRGIEILYEDGIIETRKKDNYIQDPATGRMMGSTGGSSGSGNNSSKSVANGSESGIINSGGISGALNPYSKAAEEHAERYYESVRHMTTDTTKISENTNISKDKIDKIKNHVFIEEHELLSGKHRFDPSYDIAQSWQRLISGKDTQEKDMVLLKHEYSELRYMERGLTQNQAHIKASKRYNYAKYCD